MVNEIINHQMHAAFEVRGLEKQADTNKRRRTTIDKGRLLTGEEWCDIIKDKEEKKRKEEDEKEQRKISRLEKKEQNDREKEAKKIARATKKPKPKGKSLKKAPKPTPVSQVDSAADDEAPSCSGIRTARTSVRGCRPDFILNESSDDNEQVLPIRRPVKVVDKDVCGICGGNDLPSDDESSSTIAVVEWSDCDMCHQWFHNHCIHIETTPSELICSACNVDGDIIAID